MINLRGGYLPGNFNWTDIFTEQDLGTDGLSDKFDFTSNSETQDTTFAESIRPDYSSNNFGFTSILEIPDTNFPESTGANYSSNNFGFTSILEHERSAVYSTQATSIDNSTSISEIPSSDIVDEDNRTEEFSSSDCQSIPFFGSQATETSIFASSEAHPENSVDSNTEAMIVDEDNQTEEISSSDQDQISANSATEWTKEEDLKLIEKVNKIGRRWKTLAKKFPNKTWDQIKQRYQDLQKISLQEGVNKSGRWSKSENKQLNNLISQFGGDPKTYTSEDWRKIAIQIKSRSLGQIREHWRRSLNPIVKKSNFTLKEDRIIKQKVQTIGKKWSVIAKSLRGRTGQQIQQHYENSLDDCVRKSNWTKKENQLLKDGVTSFGNKWAQIAKFINESIGLNTIRTAKQCFNHWRDLCKKSNS